MTFALQESPGLWFQMSEVFECEIGSLRDRGFLKLPMPDSLRQPATELMDVSTAIHGLPVEVLDSISTGDTQGLRGYVGSTSKQANVGSDAEKSRLYASFEFGHSVEEPKSALEEFLCAANVWPIDTRVNRDAAEAALQKFHDTAVKILECICDEFDDNIGRYFNRPTGNMRLLRYPNEPNSNVPYHRDYEFLTLIHASHPSLTIRTGGEEIAVNEANDELVVLGGDALEFLSNGTFKAAEHAARPGVERYSTVYFLCSNTEVSIDRNFNFRESWGDDFFYPARHLAGMNFANNFALRQKVDNPSLLKLMPDDLKNPFLAQQ